MIIFDGSRFTQVPYLPRRLLATAVSCQATNRRSASANNRSKPPSPTPAPPRQQPDTRVRRDPPHDGSVRFEMNTLARTNPGRTTDLYFFGLGKALQGAEVDSLSGSTPPLFMATLARLFLPTKPSGVPPASSLFCTTIIRLVRVREGHELAVVVWDSITHLWPLKP